MELHQGGLLRNEEREGQRHPMGMPNRYEPGLFDVAYPRRDTQPAYVQLFLFN